ncbi:MAG: hypothetical protein ACOY42_00210, partial [Pseudomonadota bacterium]
LRYFSKPSPANVFWRIADRSMQWDRQALLSPMWRINQRFHNGILWKDVLAANLATLAFLLVIPRRASPGTGALAASAIGIAATALIRQQMALVIPILGVAVGLSRRSEGTIPRTAAIWLGSTLAIMLTAERALVRDAKSVSGLDTEGAVYQLTTFDLAGIRAHGGQIKTPTLSAAGVDAQHLSTLFELYHPDRVDHLGAHPRNPLMAIADPVAALLPDWRRSVSANPRAYVLHRWEHFLWLLGLREPELCLPYQLGIPALPDGFPDLPLPSSRPERIAQLNAVAQYTLPLFRPVIYTAVAALALAILWVRRPHGWQGLVMLQFAGLAYTGSYLLIGIACDFRYAYFVVPVALIGIFSCWMTPAQPRTVHS